jgi:uncharacterized protein YjbJ (UPF0337 family)
MSGPDSFASIPRQRPYSPRGRWDSPARIRELFFRSRYVMKWYQIAGDWKQFTGKVKAKWGKLTDDDLTTFGGQSDQLAGLLQKKYGYAKDQANKEITEFSNEHDK